MEDDPRGFVGGPIGVGMNRGRGEDWLAAHLTRRGHTVVQQYPVWRHDQVGRYYIDVAMGRLAVELYSYWEKPWLEERQITRVQNLIQDRWRVLYVWLFDKADPQETVIDAVVRSSIDADAGSVQTYRVVDHHGNLLRVGWLNEAGQLVHNEPDPLPQWIGWTSAVTGEPWDPEPPAPPDVLDEDVASNIFGFAARHRPPKLPLEERNEIARLWWEYGQAFDAWDQERKRRKKPWETLAPVQKMTPQIAWNNRTTPQHRAEQRSLEQATPVPHQGIEDDDYGQRI